MTVKVILYPMIKYRRKKKMKITIIIETETEATPQVEVQNEQAQKEPQKPSLYDYEGFYRPPSKERAQETTQSKLPASKVGMKQPKYRDGRKIHECFRCKAPHRHNNLSLGGCVECRDLDDQEVQTMLRDMRGV